MEEDMTDAEMHWLMKISYKLPLDEIMRVATNNPQIRKSIGLISAVGPCMNPKLAASLLIAKANPNALHSSTAIQSCVIWADSLPSIAVLKLLLHFGAKPDLLGYANRQRALVNCVSRCRGDDPIRKDLARVLLWNGAAPITFKEMPRGSRPMWYRQLHRSMAHCLWAKRAVERALSKQGLVHRNVVPLIVDMVWATRLDLSFWNFEMY